MPPVAPPSLERLLERATRLYTVPVVAAEVIELLDQPGVDAERIRRCVERDPALVAKLLRVVNSAHLGLAARVSDLGQAIATLGTRPLKLLVLGFSLPDKMLVGVAGGALARYWTEALTRALAAREVARMGWGDRGDVAFVAGLLQGIGQLVLLQELRESYAAVLERLEDLPDPDPAANDHGLVAVEAETLGFDHRALSAGLLRHWRMPDIVPDAIEAQLEPAALSHAEPGIAAVARPLRLAELLTHLVCRRRLAALGPLLEEGSRYCGLTRRQVNTLVETLQAQVDELAGALGVELGLDRDYRGILLHAHARLSIVARGAALQILGAHEAAPDPDDQAYDELLGDVAELRDAVRRFLSGGGPEGDAADPPAADGGSRGEPDRLPTRGPHLTLAADAELVLQRAAVEAAAECRAARNPLSLVLIEAEPATPGAAPDSGPAASVLRRWLARSEWADETRYGQWIALGPCTAALLLPGVARHEATAMLSRIGRVSRDACGVAIDAGVASVTLVPKGFDAQRLIDAARRCLEAALAAGGASVKSIEVY